MQRLHDATVPSLFSVLRGVVERMQRVAGADIASLYPYDADSQTYYAPCATGIPEESLLGSIPDMQDQLARYLSDAAQGKVPDDLEPRQYGPNVWLTVTRRTLRASDAPREIGSSFIRRHQIQSVVGLPLVAGETLVGLLYLDFRAVTDQSARRGAPGSPGRRGRRGDGRAVALDDALLAELEREAGRAALAIERARDAEERAAFAAIGRLAAELGAPPADAVGHADELRGRRDRALVHLLEATGFDAVAIYRLASQHGELELVTERGLPGAPARLDLPAPAGPPTGDPAFDPAASEVLRQALGAAGLHAVAALSLRAAGQPRGLMLVLSRDRLAFVRRAPATRTLLQAAADLIAGALEAEQLVAALEDTNRVLGALSRMGGALLRPGATRQEVLEAIVRHLTDAQIPEFDFQYATAFLLGAAEGGGPVPVPMAARIDATAEAGGAAPRAVQLPERTIPSHDILAYVARRWQVAVIGAAESEDEIVGGYRSDQLEKHEIPAVRRDGGVSAVVRAVLLREERPGDGGTGGRGDPSPPPERTVASVRSAPSGGPGGVEGTPPFVLDGDVFDTDRHRDLVRVFVPFGLDPRARATGVLEAGYHRLHKRRLDRTQIEVLRACAAQVAVAVETARLYEDGKRHAEHLEIVTDISRAIAASIDMDQTLRLIAKHMARSVDASLCLIALYEEDGSAWYGAAASDEEELWRRQRVERPEPSVLFEVLDRRAPLAIEDAQGSEAVHPYLARLFGIRSLLALPLVADEQPIGAVVLAQRDQRRDFTAEEVQRADGLAHQAAIALKNARLHALEEEEHHIQKDIVLIGFGEWGQKAYQHLLTLKQFFNFKTHVVLRDAPGRREEMANREREILANGDAAYWDSPELPAREQLKRELESSCYVITYVAAPAATHLPLLAEYYDLSNVVLIEKPLGAPPEAYRDFLAGVDGGVEIVAADHYFFKLEVRLLQLLLTEERTLKAFLDSVEEIEIELLEERPLTGAASEIGVIADMLPHALAIISLFTPIDRITFARDAQATPGAPLLSIGRREPLQGDRETYARLVTSFPYQSRTVRLVIDVGKGVENAKWIKLSGERRAGSRRSFYKFDFIKGEAVDGTQTNLRAAVRPIRQPGVPDNAHLTMLRHAIEKKHPAVGILAIREALRSNQRIQELEALTSELLARGAWTPYRQGQRPELARAQPIPMLAEAHPPEGVAVRAG
jgi:GAF domain-containing protein